MLERLAKELTAVMAEADVRKTLTEAGLEPVMLGREAFRQLIATELVEFKAVAQRGKITID